MLKFGLFSGKSARKMGLLVLALALLLTAAPRAWGGFEITNGTEMNSGDFSVVIDGVLIISADELPDNVVISGEDEGKSIAVKGSGAKLTLRDLTVAADNGPAFWLDGSSADITIAGTVTLTGSGGEGFLVSLDNPGSSSNETNETVEVVILNASPGSALTAAGKGGNFCGLNVKGESGQQRTEYLLLLGDGNFDFTGSGTGKGLEAKNGQVHMEGSAALSAAGGLTTENQRAFAIDVLALTLLESAKIDSADGGIYTHKGFQILENASVSGDISVYEGDDSYTRVSIEVDPPGSYLVIFSEGVYVMTNSAGLGESWFSPQAMSRLTGFDSLEDEDDDGEEVAAVMVGQEEPELMQIQSVEQKGAQSFLVCLANPEEVQKDALSILYEDEADSAIETVAGENGTAIIKAITKNIPPEDYTVELHGAPEGVSLGGAEISAEATETTRAVTYNNTLGGGQEVTYPENVKEAVLTLTLEGVSVGETYSNLSFTMKKPPETREYNKEFLNKKYIQNLIAAPSTLWLPAFTLVVKEDSGTDPEPGPAPSPEPVRPPGGLLPPVPETPSDPAGVSVTTEDGKTLEAQKQPDGTYLIVVPGGSEPGSATVRIELPDGETVEWEWDVSEGPFVITVPIDGVEQEIRIEAEREPEPLPPDAEALRLVDPDPKKWLLNTRWEKDGSYSTAVAAPFILDAEKPGGPSRLLVKLEGLSSVGWSVVWLEGHKGKNEVYAKDKMLWMGGTAEDENALKNLLSVSQIEFMHEDAMHLQTFDPPVTFDLIPEGNRYMYNEPPAPVVVEKGGGCEAGFGAGVTMLTVLAACLAARKSGKRTKKAR